jgi:hypothetical protein
MLIVYFCFEIHTLIWLTKERGSRSTVHSLASACLKHARGERVDLAVTLSRF